eukprot:Rhum_TRINITY_DN15159_c3_g4::Rhum_TRINITY_DN15159_c3_g4_i2::g.140890::m.140890/K11252/H2B; histone H2B
MLAKDNDRRTPCARPEERPRSKETGTADSSLNALAQFMRHGAPRLKKRAIPSPAPSGKEYARAGKRFSRYVHRLVKVQFKERKQQITAKGMRVVTAFVEDMLERLREEAGRVTPFSGVKTLSVRSVVTAVKLQLPEELATHA